MTHTINNILSFLVKNPSSSDIFLVGGVVRDRLLGRPTTDYDLVTPMNPSSLAESIAEMFRGTAFPLDKERGVYRVTFKEGFTVDLAQRQGAAFDEDIRRRDFTINSLAIPVGQWTDASWRKSIVDLCGGRGDLKAARVVPVSAKALADDPLRLLRAFRFSAELDFECPAETLKAVSLHKNKIRKSAPERIRDEFLRIFQTDRAYHTLILMEKTGLLDILFPEAKTLRKTAPAYYGKGGVLKHTLESVFHFEEIVRDLKGWFGPARKQLQDYLTVKWAGYPRLAHCKWALLLHDIGKPATAKKIDGRLRFFQHEHVGADKVPRMAERYRWSGEETGRYAKLVRNHMRPGNLATQPEATDKAIARFFRDLGEDAVAMLLVSLGDHLTYLTPRQLKKRSSAHEVLTRKMIKKYYTRKEALIPSRIIGGYDIMKAFNLQPSPKIGRMLEDVFEAQAEGTVSNKDEAIAFLKGRLALYEK